MIKLKTFSFVSALILLTACSSNNASSSGQTEVRLSSISLSGSYQTSFDVGDTFTYEGLIVTASYSDNSSKQVTGYTVSSPNMSYAGTKDVGVTYTENSITKYTKYTITVNEVSGLVTLNSISLSGNYQTGFYVGDTFTYDGLVVTANFSDGSSSTVTGYSVVTPDLSSTGNKNVLVSYTYQSVTKSASYVVTVKQKPAEVTLKSIMLSGNYPTTFYIEDSFTYSGLIVTAKYSDNSSKQVTGYSVSNPNMSTAGSKQVTVTYVENNVTVTANYSITVNEKEVIKELETVYEEPYLGRQYYLNHIGDIYSTWKHYQGEGVTIAVIDIGFDTNHEDFTNLDGSSKISTKSASFTCNGSNVTTNVGVSYAHDTSNSHGTFCAGVAAAGLNHKGIIGVAPLANLMLLKTDAKAKSISAAFKYAADNGAKVVSISLGSYANGNGDLATDGSDLTTVFEEPVAYCRNKGTVVISAGGNGGEEGKATTPTYPGATSGVIGVGGLQVDSSTDLWSGTSTNSSTNKFIDVVAPSDGMFGICNYYNNGIHVLYDGGNDGNNMKWKGTSFAAPIVAGMAALYFEKNPTSTVSDFENKLFNSCRPISDSTASNYGRVDVANLLDIETPTSLSIKVKDTTASEMYVYAHDSVGSNGELLVWPGVKMTPSNGYFTYTINPSKYDTLIFNCDGAQTVNVLASSFIDGYVYDLSTAIEEIHPSPFNASERVNRYIGSYIKS